MVISCCFVTQLFLGIDFFGMKKLNRCECSWCVVVVAGVLSTDLVDLCDDRFLDHPSPAPM